MRARAGLDRAAVVRAAADLLDEKGRPEITLAELSARLGVRTPSLYNHINGLEDLHQALGLLGLSELGKRIGRAAMGKSGADAVQAIGGAYRSFAKEHPGLYLMTVGAATPGEFERAAVSNEIIDIVRIVLEPFRLGEAREIHAIRAIRSLVHGFVSLELSGGFGIPVDVDESFAYLLDLVIAGLRPERS